MHKRIIYICEYCGKEFINNQEACSEHERECNKCNSCAHAYYVYGCEFGCAYHDANECNAAKKFPKYEVKK